MKLTTRQVCEMLGVTHMTVWQYRRGTPTKSALPHSMEGRNVYFESKEIAAWAKKNSVAIATPIKKLQSPATTLHRKADENPRRVHRRRIKDWLG